MGNLSVFHGAPTSNDGQAVPSGIAALGIDVTTGQIYYRNPQDKTQPGWRLNTVGGSSGPFVQLNPTTDQTITGSHSLLIPGDPSLTTVLAIGPNAIADPIDQGTPGVLLCGDVNANRTLEIHNVYASGYDIYVHSNTGFRAPALNIKRSRGTETVPTAVQDGDALAYGLNIFGFDGTAYANAINFNAVADGNWSPTAHGAFIVVGNVDNGALQVQEQMRWQGVGTHLPAARVFGWDNVPGTLDTGFSRLAAGSVALGNGTASNTSGKLSLAHINVNALQSFANNAAAVTGGLVAGDLYVVTSSDPRQVAVVF